MVNRGRDFSCIISAAVSGLARQLTRISNSNNVLSSSVMSLNFNTCSLSIRMFCGEETPKGDEISPPCCSVTSRIAYILAKSLLPNTATAPTFLNASNCAVTRALGDAFKIDVSVNGSPSFIIAASRSLLGAGTVSTTGTGTGIVGGSEPNGRGVP